MEIDWLTVGAQIVNFLALVWLLQHFLYRPIIAAMDRREQRIAERLEAARRKSEQADEAARKHRAERERFEAERDGLLKEARDDAEALRKSLSADVRRDLEDKKRKWANAVDAEREEFLQELRRQSGEHFMRLARRALGDMAGADLEGRMAGVFVERLRGMAQERKRQLADAVSEAGGKLVIRSAFELPSQARRRLSKALHDEILEDAEVEYETSRAISCGIELAAGSQRLAWSLDDYLDAMESDLTRHLRQAAHAEDYRKAG
jgi:F-type H+-transporting ATPase subunit b